MLFLDTGVHLFELSDYNKNDIDIDIYLGDWIIYVGF